MYSILFPLSPPKNIPPAKNTRSQRNPAVLTPTARAPLECTPSVHTMSEDLDRGPPMEGEAPSRRGGLEAENEEVEESEETEVEAALAGTPEASGAPNLSLSKQPLVSQAETNVLNMMEQSTTHPSTYPQGKFKTPSMKAPDSFDGTQANKLRGFSQYCQLIFHNDPGPSVTGRRCFIKVFVHW
ncbi:hypothetical protein O181_067674 [Austropuccinia psidii MF-1]|uniref:Uncharacterized protein n=1 Tax=Austropuccinia psidii MF-1 TaxID=1389203 RepID=A0A9Q3EVU1_9BASI|nr:hypothetical protein [Austropuccinia psidii MF-1]